MSIWLNNHTSNSCRLCESKYIYKKYVLKYSQPILFSDKVIKLKYSPELWVCEECGSYFTQNVIKESDAQELYTTNSVNRWKKDTIEIQKTKQLRKILKCFAMAGNKVLDIGSNTGELLDYFSKRGCKTFGIEYSKLGRAISKKKRHQTYESFQKLPKIYKFDVILAFDLFEHLYNVKEFLKYCEKSLTRNGKIVILTGNHECVSSKISSSKWWYYLYPEHITFPSKRYFQSLRRLRFIKYINVFNDVGFKNMNIFTIDNMFLQRFVDLVAAFIKNRYNGLPSLDKDHALIILSLNE